MPGPTGNSTIRISFAARLGLVGDGCELMGAPSGLETGGGRGGAWGTGFGGDLLIGNVP